MRLFLIVFTFCFSLLSNADSSLNTWGISFVSIGNKIFIAGSDEKELLNECRGLRDYSKFIKEKNQEIFLDTNCDILISNFSDAQKSQLKYLSDYFNDEPNMNLKIASIKLDVTNFVPMFLQNRLQQNRLYDGVCYNGALVGSGILSKGRYSEFEADIDNYLGMSDISYRIDESSRMITVEPIKRHSADFIQNRKAWDIPLNEPTHVINQIGEFVKGHFSPGSILCLSVSPIRGAEYIKKHVKEIEAKARGYSVNVHHKLKTEEFYIENRGDHCLNFISPNLITETNRGAKHELSNWKLPFKKYLKQAKMMDRQIISAYYFQTDNLKILSSKERQTEFLGLTKNHRNFVETLNDPSLFRRDPNFHLYSSIRAYTPRPKAIEEAIEYFSTQIVPAIFNDQYSKYLDVISRAESSYVGELKLLNLLNNPEFRLWLEIFETSSMVLEK